MKDPEAKILQLQKRIDQLEKEISKQKNVEEKLKESENRYRHLFNNALVGLFRAKIDSGLFIEMNERGAQMQGIPREEIIGKVKSSNLYKDPKQREQLVEMLSSGGRVDDFDADIILQNGEERVFSISVKSYPEENFLEGAVIDVTEKKELEKKIIASEKQYRNLAEQSPLGIVIAKNNPVRLCYANKSMFDLSGHTKEELLKFGSEQLAALIHPEDRNRFFTNFQKRLEGENIGLQNAYKVVHRNGKIKHVEVHSSKIIYDNESATQTQFLDITERINAENALRESEELYRSLYETALVGMWRSRIRDGKLLKSNMAHAKLSGFSSPEEAIKANFCLKDLYPEKERNELLETLYKYGEVRNFEAHLTYEDGREQDISVSAKLVAEEYMEGVVIDITEKKQAEKKLKESEKKYRTLFDNLMDMYYQADIEGTLVLISPTGAEMLGYDSTNEIIGANIEEHFLFYPLEKQILIEILIAKKSIKNFKIALKHKDGHKIYGETNSRIIYDENGNATGFEGMIRDVTEKFLTEEKLKENERLMLQKMIEAEENERNRFAMELHDGLSPVLSSLKLHLDAFVNTKDIEQQDAILKKSYSIIEQAIDETKMISNNLSPHVINDFGLAIAIREFIHMIPKSKIHIDYITNIEEKRFKRIIEIVLYRTTKELIHNTIKHANASNISIQIIQDKNLLILLYSDDGIGFNVENHLNIYNIKGTGLKNIEKQVNSINGSFKINSNQEGINVHITIHL